MPTITFTTEQKQNFFSDKYHHAAYDETVEMAESIKIHAMGIYPKALIEERRPSESLAVKDYREKIWKPITKGIFSKIITSLSKIRRSSDWSIKFDEATQPGIIADGEGLPDYCEINFPYFTSLTNWAFSVLLKAYTMDANALICIYPIKENIVENSHLRPFPFLFYSDQVIEYIENDYAVLKGADKVLFTENKVQKWGDCYYIITTVSIQRWEQIKSDRTMSLAWEYKHDLGQLPVIKTKGIFKKALENNFIFESRLSSIIPRLDEAIREYSDLQAEVVQHIFSEKWEFVADDCATCKGTGKVRGSGFLAGDSECNVCGGTGGKPRGPYTTLQLKAPMAAESALPTPPMGYVTKQIEIVEIQDKRIDKHIYQALSAINMEFLANTPLSESGISKEVDRDELNNFVHAIAEDIVSILDTVVYFITQYRYGVLIPSFEKRLAMLPKINVPEKFDILSTNYLETQLQNAKTNKVNPAIVNSMEIEYANKKFNNDTQVRDLVTLVLSLDPLAGISEDDKMLRLSNEGITKETYIISCNIQEFINRAIEEKGDVFYTLPLKDKKALIKEYAQEQIAAGSMSADILMNE